MDNLLAQSIFPDLFFALSGCLGCDFGLGVPGRGLFILGLCLDLIQHSSTR